MICALTVSPQREADRQEFLDYIFGDETAPVALYTTPETRLTKPDEKIDLGDVL